MLVSTVRRARTRLIAGAALAALVLTLAAARPASAHAEPPADDARSHIGAGLVALLAALDPHDDHRPGVATEGCVDAATAGATVPWLVVEIFTCRMLEAGVSAEEARAVAAEALVVSHCESLWKRKAVVFDGRYLDRAHPRTGSRHSAAGVFQFIRATADTWIDGGYAEVTDARRNIDAAARLYIHNRVSGLAGWEDWACAAANDGFKDGSVLPGWPGGPAALPDWVDKYLP